MGDTLAPAASAGESKTEAQLSGELAELRRQMAELETSEAKRKQTEEALRESEEWLRGILAQSPIGIELYDATGRLLDANPSCLDMFGIVDKEDIKGFELFQDPNLPRDAKERLLNGEIVRYEAEFDFELVKRKALYRTTKSGRRYLDVIITVLGTQGNVRGYLAQVQDITERKRMETALREREEHFQSLVESQGEGMGVVDTQEQFTFANPAAENIFGVSPGGLVGHSLAEFLAPEQFAAVRQQTEHRRTGETSAYEIEVSRPDGEKRNLIVTATPQIQDGQFVGAFGVFRDITERKRAEAELRRMANRQTTLYEMIRAVSGQLDLDAVTRLAVEAIFKFAGWPQASIIMPNEGGTHWVIRAASGRLLRAAGMTAPIDKGVTGRTFKAGKTQLVSDVSVDPDYLVGDPATRSCLTVPLKRGERVVGVLNLESDQLAAFDSDDVLLAESLADAIVLTLDNARLYAQAQRHTTDLSALYAITRTTSRSLALEDVLEQALSSVITLMGFGAGLIVLAEPDSNRLRLAAARGLSPALLERIRRQGLESTLAAYVYNRRESLVLGESQQEAPPEVSQAFDDLKTQGWRAYVGIPLLQQEQPLGAITLLAREPRPSSAYDLALLTTLGQQVATAVANARMFQTTLHERSQLQALIKSSRDGIVLIGTSGHILVINAPALQLLHLPGQPEEWRGRPVQAALAVLRVFVPKILRVALPELRRIRSGDEPPNEGEYEVSPHAVHWLNLPVLTGSIPQGRLVVLRDVTDARAVERLREDMTHTMVHDLRNPLGNISASLEALTGGMLGSLPPDQLEVLNIAQSSAYRMVELVSAILDVSRLESGQMPLDQQVFSLANLVADALQLQMTLASEKNIHLESNVPLTLPPVWADTGLIGRVLQNLVGNAIKFTPPDGVIRVSARTEEKQRRSMILVSVSDTGPGIPPEIAGRLFQKFVAGRQTGRGSGLGLAFCKLAVEAHGGRIWVESTPGNGATFTFSLATALGP
jgi:PAS domain S-box-containing protein